MLVTQTELERYMDIKFSNRQSHAATYVLEGLQSEMETILRRPVEVQSFNANDYGLYNMAGNVSEWTNSSYNPNSYYMGSTMNANVEDRANNRKIIRGGSWKDVAYFLEVSTRDFEYGDTARSYIGFRTVQSKLGANNQANN